MAHVFEEEKDKNNEKSTNFLYYRIRECAALSSVTEFFLINHYKNYYRFILKIFLVTILGKNF